MQHYLNGNQYQLLLRHEIKSVSFFSLMTSFNHFLIPFPLAPLCPCLSVTPDEPTNHLDMGAIEALANALKGFSGGVLVISHDQVSFISTLSKVNSHSRLLVSYERGECFSPPLPSLLFYHLVCSISFLLSIHYCIEWSANRSYS